MAKTAEKSSWNKRPSRAAALLALVFGSALLCAAHTGVEQSSGVNQGGPEYLHTQPGLNPIPRSNKSEAESKVDQMRRAERRNRLAQDTAKLVELSNELKAEVEQTPADQVSVKSTQKAASIEKLARDVRQWLTN